MSKATNMKDATSEKANDGKLNDGVTEPMTPPPNPRELNLPNAIKQGLEARIERMLSRPLIARIAGHLADTERLRRLEDDVTSDPWQAMTRRAGESVRSNSANQDFIQQAADGTFSIPIHIDYEDLWRGKESEVERMLIGSKENLVVFLTPHQEALLRRTPREFLALRPRPMAVELVDFRKDDLERVVGIMVAAPPKDELHGSVAIVPNLVQLQRQLDALAIVTQADAPPSMFPLRALVGIEDLGSAPTRECGQHHEPLLGKLDEQQRDAVLKALRSPHFSVIHGPPGSGKTSVIAEIVRASVGRGERVLIVSPTHVAVDNVVERLARLPKLESDTLEPHTLPIRFSSRRSVVGPGAQPYWVGPRNGARDATLVGRLHGILRKACPEVATLPEESLKRLELSPELSKALCALSPVICGTPIGILSKPDVKDVQPGTFDLLIVDEVSKMLLPEFLAVAVKARRWVLVGDPKQLPPFLDGADAAVAFDQTLSPMTELVCSVAGILERAKPAARSQLQLVVVSDDPGRAVEAIRAHLAETLVNNLPEIMKAEAVSLRGIVVCLPDQIMDVFQRLSPVARFDRGHNPENVGGIELLVQRGLRVPRPSVGGGLRFVEERDRAASRMMECAFNCYHSQAWSMENNIKLDQVTFRKGLPKFLPSRATVGSDHPALNQLEIEAERARLLRAIAHLYATGAVSVYDWLVGMPDQHFDVAPLSQLRELHPRHLTAAVGMHCGKLTTQYRMRPALSMVPRQLFYRGEALLDPPENHADDGNVDLFQVDQNEPSGRESNEAEARFIVECLVDLAAFPSSEPGARNVMVITPYVEQMNLLRDRIESARRENRLDGLIVECLTIDRCQGREADYVFISLVKSQASVFLDSPKRWNVALTRARYGLALVGDIKAYEYAARKARVEATRSGELRMRLLARIVEAYQSQNTRYRQSAA